MRSNIPASTLRVINRYGKNVDYLRVSEGVYDIESSSMTQETIVTVTVKSYRTKISYSESQNPSLIGKDSSVYLIAGKSINFVPDVGDRIVDSSDGSDYQVLLVSKIDLQDEIALWRLVCVRG